MNGSTQYLKENQITVKELKKILEDFDDDVVVKFRFNNEFWNLTSYYLKEPVKKPNELIFQQKFRNIRHQVDGRWFSDHTSRKGSWIEDKKTNRKYYLGDSMDVISIVSILNEYEKLLTGKTYQYNRILM